MRVVLGSRAIESDGRVERPFESELKGTRGGEPSSVVPKEPVVSPISVDWVVSPLRVRLAREVVVVRSLSFDRVGDGTVLVNVKLSSGVVFVPGVLADVLSDLASVAVAVAVATAELGLVVAPGHG